LGGFGCKPFAAFNEQKEHAGAKTEEPDGEAGDNVSERADMMEGHEKRWTPPAFNPRIRA
jgi:hypothetical protein